MNLLDFVLVGGFAALILVAWVRTRPLDSDELIKLMRLVEQSPSLERMFQRETPRTWRRYHLDRAAAIAEADRRQMVEDDLAKMLRQTARSMANEAAL